MKDNLIAKYTVEDFEREFPNDDACLEWLKNYRFPNGIHCPICDKITKRHKITNRHCYKCDNCGHEVYPTSGTIFHKSSTPLKIWLEAIFWMSATRSGHSAKELQRKTGVTYKTAWRMFKEIRNLLDEKYPTFMGEVEVDETYIGGIRRGTRGRGAQGKTAVAGIIQRKGNIVTKVVPNVKRSTITPIITSNVARDTIIYTDEFPTYDHLTYIGFKHERINHRAKQYVRGRAHTNNIEGFWSQVKRGISGVYHSVSPKYLQSYLNEYAFRYNHRKDEIPMFKLFLNQI
ncbi:MAG: IS1595 family transposase [Chloroflexi bacterium]|nr:IS1595 family transposase [Chloroflexota bacterium]